MLNFTYYTPTKVFFGKDTEKEVGKIIKSYGFKKIMLHYGKASIKKSGLYDVIVNSLKENGIEFFELGGVEANPKLSLVKEGAELCKKEKPELILAVGGGSVIDSSKAIGAAALVDFDPFLFNMKEKTPEKTIPVATVLTLAAAGSEMSSSCVVTDEKRKLKRGFSSDLNRPLFSIMNPELTFSVSPFQTACGTVDIMMHTLERYFTREKNVDLTDRIAEGLLKSVVDAGRKAMANPEDYEARATLMWASSLSHNDLTGAGRQVFLTCHQIAHEINAIYDNLAHGETLAIVFPAWAKYMSKKVVTPFAQYAERVFDVKGNTPEAAAEEGIRLTEEYFKSLGMPTTLAEVNVDSALFDEMAEKCTNMGKRKLDCLLPLDKQDIINILNIAKGV
mgnify:CR=1 FL=1